MFVHYKSTTKSGAKLAQAIEAAHEALSMSERAHQGINKPKARLLDQQYWNSLFESSQKKESQEEFKDKGHFAQYHYYESRRQTVQLHYESWRLYLEYATYRLTEAAAALKKELERVRPSVNSITDWHEKGVLMNNWVIGDSLRAQMERWIEADTSEYKNDITHGAGCEVMEKLYHRLFETTDRVSGLCIADPIDPAEITAVPVTYLSTNDGYVQLSKIGDKLDIVKELLALQRQVTDIFRNLNEPQFERMKTRYQSDPAKLAEATEAQNLRRAVLLGATLQLQENAKAAAETASWLRKLIAWGRSYDPAALYVWCFQSNRTPGGVRSFAQRCKWNTLIFAEAVLHRIETSIASSRIDKSADDAMALAYATLERGFGGSTPLPLPY